MSSNTRIVSFFNPDIPMAPSLGDQLIWQQSGPGKLKFLQVLDNGQGLIGYTLLDRAAQPQNLLQSFYINVSAAALPGSYPSAYNYLFPFIEVETMTQPQNIGVSSSLTASTVFSVNTTSWAGSFNTDGSGDVENETYQLNSDLLISTQLELHVNNFSTTSNDYFISVRADYEIYQTGQGATFSDAQNRAAQTMVDLGADPALLAPQPIARGSRRGGR